MSTHCYIYSRIAFNQNEPVFEYCCLLLLTTHIFKKFIYKNLRAPIIHLSHFFMNYVQVSECVQQQPKAIK